MIKIVISIFFAVASNTNICLCVGDLALTDTELATSVIQFTSVKKTHSSTTSVLQIHSLLKLFSVICIKAVNEFDRRTDRYFLCR